MRIAQVRYGVSVRAVEVHRLNFDETVATNSQYPFSSGDFHNGDIKRNFRRRWSAADGDFSAELVLKKHECLSISFQSLLKNGKPLFVAKNRYRYWRNGVRAIKNALASRFYDITVNHSVWTNKPITSGINANRIYGAYSKCILIFDALCALPLDRRKKRTNAPIGTRNGLVA